MVTMIFLVLQSFITYNITVSSELASNYGVDINHFSWVNSLTICIGVTFINVWLQQKAERTLMKAAAVIGFISSMLVLAMISLQVIYSSNL